MLIDWTYGVELRFEEGAYRAYASCDPSAFASGATEAEALDEMGKALHASVAGSMHFGTEVTPPGPPTPAETYRISLPPALAAKASVYVMWRRSGLSKVALATRMGLNENEIRRIFDPKRATGIDRLAAVAEALGHSLRVTGEMHEAA